MVNPKALAVRVTAISHATEQPTKVASAMSNVFPECSARLEGTKASGHYGNEIRILRSEVRSQSIAEEFLAHFWARMSASDRSQVISKVTEYMSVDDGVLFLRVDKQQALEGELKLAPTEPIRVEIIFNIRGISRDEIAQLIASKLESLVE